MATVYEDPKALARAIQRALEVYGVTQKSLAETLGVDRQTIRRILAAEPGSVGKNAGQRRTLALAVIEATGAPRDWFGLSEPTAISAPAVQQRQIDSLRLELADLRRDVTALLAESGRGAARKASRRATPKPDETSGVAADGG